MKNWPKILLIDTAAILLGMLLTFAFAPYEIFPLAIVAPAGLLALLLNVSPKRAFWLGFLFGIGLFGVGVYWVFNSIHDIGGVPAALAIFITAGMVAVLAVYPGLVCWATNRFFPINNTTKLVCAFPAIWVFGEILRGRLFTGFPWLFIGYSQTNSPLKGIAPFLSVYGVSLAVLVTSALIVNCVLKYKQKEFKTIYFSLFAIVSIWTASSLFTLIPWTKPQGDPISVGLVQGNIPQILKWDPNHIKLSFDRYLELSEPLWGKNKIIIWPEAAIPLPLNYAEKFIGDMDAKAKETGTALILGIPLQSPNGGFYNAVVSVGADQRAYHKRQLVPFGEYTPLAQYFSRALDFMNLPMSNDVAGKINQDPFIVNNTKILMSICYEVAFPELMHSSDKSIGFLLTVTNDAWFGRSNAQAQHLQMAAMRAVELGRPAVFVSNDGITAIIAPNGTITAAAPSHVPTVLSGEVQPMFGLTPWMRNGVDPVSFILLCLLYSAVRARQKNKTATPTEKLTLTSE